MKLTYSILLFAAYSLTSGFGLILLKRSLTGINLRLSFNSIINAISLELIIGFFLYAIGFICWMAILSKFNLNIAFPIAMSLFFIVTGFGSYFILGEALNLKVIVGMIICLAGIILISVG